MQPRSFHLLSDLRVFITCLGVGAFVSATACGETTSDPFAGGPTGNSSSATAGGTTSGAGGSGGDATSSTTSTSSTSSTGGSTGGATTASGSGGNTTATNAGGAAGAGTGGAGTGGTGGGSVPDAGGGGSQLPDGGPLEPPPGTYGRRAALLASNSEMAAAELDGKIYVLGGYPSSRVVQATVQVYDPATDKWAYTTPLPVPIHHPVAAGVGGKLYSLGGQLESSDTNRALVYDPAVPNSPWVDLMPMPTARGAGAGAVIDDKIYVAGGRPPADNAFEVYDISDNRWTPLPDLPQTLPNRNHIAAAAIGGKIYVAGGRYNGGSFSDPITASLDVFDPAMNMWQSRANMPRPRGGVNGVVAYGCFHVWGGEGAANEPNGVFPDHDFYNPLTNMWMSLERLPTPIHGVTGAGFVNGLIYMPGGGTSQGGSSGSTIFQVYRPAVRCE